MATWKTEGSIPRPLIIPSTERRFLGAPAAFHARRYASAYAVLANDSRLGDNPRRSPTHRAPGSAVGPPASSDRVLAGAVPALGVRQVPAQSRPCVLAHPPELMESQ